MGFQPYAADGKGGCPELNGSYGDDPLKVVFDASVPDDATSIPRRVLRAAVEFAFDDDRARDVYGYHSEKFDYWLVAVIPEDLEEARRRIELASS